METNLQVLQKRRNLASWATISLSSKTLFNGVWNNHEVQWCKSIWTKYVLQPKKPTRLCLSAEGKGMYLEEGTMFLHQLPGLTWRVLIVVIILIGWKWHTEGKVAACNKNKTFKRFSLQSYEEVVRQYPAGRLADCILIESWSSYLCIMLLHNHAPNLN
jgi:hypothetical protein